MDAFLAKVSYHATSYAIRSCLALTSTYVIQQGSRLLKVRKQMKTTPCIYTITKSPGYLIAAQADYVIRLSTMTPYGPS